MTEEQLLDGLKQIIKYAKEKGKIVVATADTRYLDSKDNLAFEALVHAKGIKNSRHYLYDGRMKYNLSIPMQDFLTTDEMIKQFEFLNDEYLIKEIVIDNTNLIANKADNLQIIKEGLFTPKYDNSDVKLKELVYENAYKKYGKVLPQYIQERIDAELNPIIKYGFSVIY
ncbi:UNVERIFIED_CONTAM: hypothetical protein O8I53_05845 [Campylobacter lari]